MKWINLIGLAFQFFAFWFAAPELLGESALRRFETGLKRLVTALPILTLLFVVLLFGLGLGGYGVYIGLKGSKEGMATSDLTGYFILMGLSSAAYFVFLIFFKRIQSWIGRRIAEPLIEQLINRSETRKQALIIGAVLFTIGFLLQFTVAALA